MPEKNDTNYNKPIDRTTGRLAGNSRKAGAAPLEVKEKAVEAIRKYAGLYGFDEHWTKEVLKIVEHESGFNPDAANKKTTASGLGQIMNDTFKQYGPHGANIFDLDSNAEATVRYYQHCRNIAAKEKGLTGDNLDVGAYQCYHDGENHFRNAKDKHGKDIYNNEIKKKKGIPHALNDDNSLDDSGSDTDKSAEATERNTVRTTPDRQAEGMSPSKDEKRKDLAGNGVNSDADNEPFQSGLGEARKQKMQDAVMLPEAEVSGASGGGDEVHFADDPSSPMWRAMAALELTADDVHLTPAEADNGNETLGAFDIRDSDTSEIIGSYAGTPTGCEITVGDKKVVMNRMTDSDVSLERYTKNDDGDFEFQGMSRIGDNDGITLRRPFAA